MSDEPNELTIGALAERTGLSLAAVRFYEEKGLVSPRRTEGGQRRFTRHDVRRLSFVRITQRLGFTLEEIRVELDALPGGRTPTKRDWERLARRFRGELDARIRGLEALRDRLTSCIGCGCLSLQACAIYNPDDEAGEDGDGPRFLLDAIDGV